MLYSFKSRLKTLEKRIPKKDEDATTGILWIGTVKGGDGKLKINPNALEVNFGPPYERREITLSQEIVAEETASLRQSLSSDTET